MSIQELNEHEHVGRALDAIKLSMRDIAIAELGIKSLPRKTYLAGTLMMNPDMEIRSVCFIVSGRVRTLPAIPHRGADLL